MTSLLTTMSAIPMAPYPPTINLEEKVDPHDRPYADFSHLSNLIYNNLLMLLLYQSSFQSS
jgi:hypothetical protein